MAGEDVFEAIAPLLAPISEETPAGEDLEYDPEFLELERLAQGKPEQVIGDHVKEAEEPDWKAVRKQAEALLGRSKDLRAAVHYTHASLKTHGWAGLRDGLALVHGLSERFWESVHPQLDPDDADPTLRCNAVAELANPAQLVLDVVRAPFVSARIAGEFCLRDLRVISGKLSPQTGDHRPTPTAQLVEAALSEVGGEAVGETAAQVTSALESARAIGTLYSTRVGEVDAPDLQRLIGEIREVEAFLQAHLGGGVAGGQQASAADDSAPAGAVGQPVTGDVTSRRDVIRLLDKICDFYARAEPSSPVPLLLRRARNLVDKDFMAIVADLTPSGLTEAERFRGVMPEDQAAWSDGSSDSDGGSAW